MHLVKAKLECSYAYLEGFLHLKAPTRAGQQAQSNKKLSNVVILAKARVLQSRHPAFPHSMPAPESNASVSYQYCESGFSTSYLAREMDILLKFTKRKCFFSFRAREALSEEIPQERVFQDSAATGEGSWDAHQKLCTRCLFFLQKPSSSLAEYSPNPKWIL